MSAGLEEARALLKAREADIATLEQSGFEKDVCLATFADDVGFAMEDLERTGGNRLVDAEVRLGQVLAIARGVRRIAETARQAACGGVR